MSRLKAIYSLLDQTHEPSVDRALAEALPSADPEAMKLIGLKLLLRQDTDGMAAVVEQYHRFPGELQETVLKCADRLDGALRVVCGRHMVQGSLNAIRIVRWSGAGRLAYLVVEQLKSRHDGVRRAAAECLLNLTEQYLSPGADGENQGWVEDTGRVYEAVVEAVRIYPTHQDENVLRALMRFAPRPIHQGLKYLSDPKSPATRAMEQLLTAAAWPEVRGGMLTVLRAPALAEAVGRGLDRAAAGGQGLGEMVGNAHLLLDHRIRRRLEGFKDPGRFWPTGSEVATWSAGAVRGLAAWAESLPWPIEKRVMKLAELRGVEDDAARLGALRRLMESADGAHDSRPVCSAIASYCQDPCETVARIATRFLHLQGWPGLTNLLLGLVNSRHASVAQLAEELLRPEIFERVWRGWPVMTARQQAAAGRAVVKIDPRCVERLEAKLTARDRSLVLRALAMIQTLGLASGLETQLVRLFRQDDEVVASAVVKTLGFIDSAIAGGLVVEALSHPNDRVRANAVEAMDREAARREEARLWTMADRDHNRARANAIGALVEVGGGPVNERLIRMLKDPGPAHRVSALWLVERLGMSQSAAAVGEMAVSDHDPRVRERAGRVFGGLIRLMKQEPISSRGADEVPRRNPVAPIEPSLNMAA